MPKKTTQTKPYREALLEALADPVEAAHYLNAALDDSPEMFLKAVRNVAQARQMARVAKEAGVTRENLYRAFSGEGNPTWDTLRSVLGVLGVKMAFEPETTNPDVGELFDSTLTPSHVRSVVRLRGVGIRGHAGRVSGTRSALSGQYGIGLASATRLVQVNVHGKASLPQMQADIGKNQLGLTAVEKTLGISLPYSASTSAEPDSYSERFANLYSS